jgi:hypothetical protein
MYNLKSKLLLSQTKIEIDTSVIYSYSDFYVYLSKPNGSLRFMVNVIDYENLGKSSMIYQVVSKISVNLRELEDEEQEQVRSELTLC